MANNMRIAIRKKDGTLIEFQVEMELNDGIAEIFTEVPIDNKSELIDFFEDKEEQFYYTSLGDLLDDYESVELSKIKNIKIEQLKLE